MEWTDKPTEAGLYQYRPLHSLVLVFFHVERMRNGRLVAMVEGLDDLELGQLRGHWRGPIVDMSSWQ